MTDLDKLFVYLVMFGGLFIIGYALYGALRLAIIIGDKIRARKARSKRPHQECIAIDTPDRTVYLTFTWR
jgi:hypothetical protein